MATPEILNILPETVPYNPRKQYIIDHSGMMNKITFQVLAGIFSAMGIIAALVRIGVHLKYRRKLFVDDYLILFATACLAVETGILYHFCDMVYIISAVTKDPKNIALFTRSEVLALGGMLKWNNIFLCFAWSTNYIIKLSFLAFFRTLIRDLSRPLNWYWWFVLVFMMASWIFNVIENFIICGATNSYVLSDLMIISIPIIIVNMSQLRLSQRLRILSFLCLNIFMAAFCLTRIAGSVGVLMGGVTAFRTVFASRIRERKRRHPESSSSHFYYRFRKFFNRGDLFGQEQRDENGDLLTVPRTGGTLKGLKTFIRRHNREPGQTTDDASTWNNSVSNSMYSYHAFKKSEKRDMGSDRVTTPKRGDEADTMTQVR